MALGRGAALQDLLRLLTLWFQSGDRRDVEAAVRAGCDSVSADLWLLVTPQIIARIHSPSTGVRDSVNRLLAQVARSHPQVCPRTPECLPLRRLGAAAVLILVQRWVGSCLEGGEGGRLAPPSATRTRLCAACDASRTLDDGQSAAGRD